MPTPREAAGPRVVVVGAGLTGLTAAYTLARRGADVVVLEASHRVGGVVASARHDGRLVEAGPNSAAASPALWALVRELGLEREVVLARPAARRRYVVHDGALHALPGSPLALLRTPLLTAAGTWRLLREPFADGPPDGDESVAAFVRRRAGPEVAARLAGALVTGIFAGDAERLSVRHALPRVAELERRHGSLVRGMLHALARSGRAARRDDGPRGSLSFRDGLATLPRALAAALGPRVRCGDAAGAIVPHEDGGWRVRVGGHDGTHGVAAEVDADVVVVTVPAHAMRGIAVPAALRDALAPVAAVRHAPVATMTLAFARADVAHALDGMGALVAPRERTPLKGVLFSSSAFDGRCADDEVMLTCFVGGVAAPADAAADTDALLPRVLAELRRLLGVRGAPRLVRHTRIARAIPQYELGYDAVLAAADGVERGWPGLVLAGSWRGGIAVGDCVAGGRAAAARALAAARHASPTAAGAAG